MLIRPVLLYANETWTIADEKQIVIFERKMLRHIFGGVQEMGCGAGATTMNYISCERNET